MNKSSHISNGSNEEKMLQYVRQELTPEERHAFEKEMLEDPFLDDAAEGLSGVSNTANIAHMVQELNEDLKKNLQKKKTQARHRKFQTPPFFFITIAIVLLLIILLVLFFSRS